MKRGYYVVESFFLLSKKKSINPGLEVPERLAEQFKDEKASPENQKPR